MITQYFTKETMMNRDIESMASIFQHAYEHRKYILCRAHIAVYSSTDKCFKACHRNGFFYFICLARDGQKIKERISTVSAI